MYIIHTKWFRIYTKTISSDKYKKIGKIMSYESFLIKENLKLFGLGG